MLTALVLQLIQCVVDLPDHLNKSKDSHGTANNVPEKKGDPNDKSPNAKTLGVDREVLINSRYEKSMATAYSFLSVFLQKTGSKNEEIDYRPLFENFVQDLLLTVNKPEWPAAELLLSLLGKLLVEKFSNQKTDVTLRVASLDYLGVVAARLRRDAVTSQLKVTTIDQIIARVKEEEDRDAPFLEDGTVPQLNASLENGVSDRHSSSKKGHSKKKKSSSNSRDEVSSPTKSLEEAKDDEEERCKFIQRVLLDWLAVNAESDPALLHARHFYIGQWYRDAYSEILRQKCGPLITNTPKSSRKHHHTQHRKRRKRKGDTSSEESEPDSEDDDERGAENHISEELKTQVKHLAESRKQFLLTKVSAFPPASPGARTQTLQTHLGYDDAELITRYLAAKRSFSQSFAFYLMQVSNYLFFCFFQYMAVYIRTDISFIKMFVLFFFS